MERLLKDGSVVSGEGWAQKGMLIESGIIEWVGADLTYKMKNVGAVVDIPGKWLFPEFINAHTHFDLTVAGTVTADNFETGTEAAISGGTTAILDFYTQYRGESLRTALGNWHKKVDGVSPCDYEFHLAISGWNDDICEESAKVVADGVSSFRLCMTYDDTIPDDEAIYEALARPRELGGITGVHCENSGVIKAMMREARAAGHMNTSAHSATRPAMMEAEAISRLLKIAAIVDTPVTIVHLSSGTGCQEMKYAREWDQEVYLETCPQYLLLDESKYRLPDPEGGRYTIASPPRRVEDQTGLWNALKKDHIHTISTDHYSFTLAQEEAGKDDLTKIPGDIAGVETRPVLIYTCGVLTGRLTIEQVCCLLSEDPVKLYGMYPQKGCIAPGSDTNIMVQEPGEARTLTKDNQMVNVDYQAYEGFKVKRKTEKVYLHGELVVEDGRVVKEFGGGYVRRKTQTEIN